MFSFVGTLVSSALKATVGVAEVVVGVPLALIDEGDTFVDGLENIVESITDLVDGE